jgi:cell division septation protein DedD
MSDQEVIGPNDRFDDPFADEPFEEPRSGMSARSKVLAGGAFLVGVVALGSVSWYAFQQGLRSGAEGVAPVIHAESQPIKRKPEKPGGLNVPDQDKLVFNRLAPGQVQEPVERLLPPPEEPAKRPQPAKPYQQIPPPTATPVDTVEAAPPPPPQPPANAPEPNKTRQSAAPPAPTPEPATAREPALAAASAPAPSGEWKIQISAVSREATAESEWKRIQSRHTNLLGALTFNVQSVTSPKGTFYRIQAGPLADRDAASAVCAGLRAQKQDCLVVAP